MNWKLISILICSLGLSAWIASASSAGPLDEWHLRDSKAADQPLYDVVFGEGLFVAVGAAGTIVTSPDGANWSRQNSGTTASISPIVYGRRMFLTSGYSDGAPDTLIRSNDGTNWISSRWNSNDPIRGLGYANGIFFVLSSVQVTGGKESCIIYTSTNTIDWTRMITGYAGTPGSIAYGNGLYLVAGTAAATVGANRVPFVLTSHDAITWKKIDFDSPLYWNMVFEDVVYAENMFVVAVAITGGARIATTTNGADWRFVWPGLVDVTSVAYGEGIFAVVGSLGTLGTATDGLNWTVRDPGTQYWLSGVAYGQNTFVLVGNNGLIFQSDPIVTLGLSRGASPALSLTGPPGRACEIQALDELLNTNNWQILGTVTLTNSAVSWTDPESTNKPQRFYRAVLQQ